MNMLKLSVLLFVSALPCFAGSFTDSRDGQSYKTVEIGNQTWMAENLNYAAPGSNCYRGKDANCTKFGRNYHYKSATQACPAGWHLPTEAEVRLLLIAAGGRHDCQVFENDTICGFEGEEFYFDSDLCSKKGWASGGGKNKYGFSAKPARYKEFVIEGKQTDYGCGVGFDGQPIAKQCALFWGVEDGGGCGVLLGLYGKTGASLSGLLLCEDGDLKIDASVRCVQDSDTEKSQVR